MTKYIIDKIYKEVNKINKMNVSEREKLYHLNNEIREIIISIQLNDIKKQKEDLEKLKKIRKLLKFIR